MVSQRITCAPGDLTITVNGESIDVRNFQIGITPPTQEELDAEHVAKVLAELSEGDEAYLARQRMFNFIAGSIGQALVPLTDI